MAHNMDAHSKECYARALICAIENIVDDSHYSRVDMYLAVQGLELRDIALDYYDGLIFDCICNVHSEGE